MGGEDRPGLLERTEGPGLEEKVHSCTPQQREGADFVPTMQFYFECLWETFRSLFTKARTSS